MVRSSRTDGRGLIPGEVARFPLPQVGAPGATWERTPFREGRALSRPRITRGERHEDPREPDGAAPEQGEGVLDAVHRLQG